jgi:hypothetical protein
VPLLGPCALACLALGRSTHELEYRRAARRHARAVLDLALKPG